MLFGMDHEIIAKHFGLFGSASRWTTKRYEATLRDHCGQLEAVANTKYQQGFRRFGALRAYSEAARNGTKFARKKFFAGRNE